MQLRLVVIAAPALHSAHHGRREMLSPDAQFDHRLAAAIVSNDEHRPAHACAKADLVRLDRCGGGSRILRLGGFGCAPTFDVSDERELGRRREWRHVRNRHGAPVEGAGGDSCLGRMRRAKAATGSNRSITPPNKNRKYTGNTFNDNALTKHAICHSGRRMHTFVRRSVIVDCVENPVSGCGRRR
jgi:hypothetical protein